MLSLKSTRPNQGSQSKRLLDLPPELLESILQHLEKSHGSGGAALLLVSMVCKQIRALASSLLFEIVHVVFSKRLHRYGETCIEFLCRASHLHRYIRCVVIHRPLRGAEHDEGQCGLLNNLLPRLNNLTEVRLSELNLRSASVIDAVLSKRGTTSLVTQCLPLRPLQLFSRDSQTQKLCKFIAAASMDVDSGSFLRGGSLILPDGCSLKACYLHEEMGLNLQEPHRNGKTPATETCRSTPITSHLEELVVCKVAREAPNLLTDQLFLTEIPWSNLRRLCLLGRRTILGLFPRIAPLLTSLRYLTLQCDERNPSGSFLKILDSLCERRLSPPGQYLTQLSCLKLVGLAAILRPQEFGRLGLKTLSLHTDESCQFMTDHAQSYVEDLRQCSKLSPNLERLEIDIGGDLSNLWHPTAIPGVDVDVQLYHVLEAITTFPNLKSLRLFPRYDAVLRPGHYHFHTLPPDYRQPMSDHQAVKIFRFLRAKRPSLSNLSITADNKTFPRRPRGSFQPMSWKIHAEGTKTILITRQQSADYEQKQVWEGERRLRTEIRRFAYEKPYMSEAEGWILHEWIVNGLGLLEE